MSLEAWYLEAKTWQQGIAAFVGFMGLMTAALWNFRLNRRRDEALRSDEIKSVAAALYGEIRLLRTRTASVARAVASVYVQSGLDGRYSIKFDEHFAEAHRMPDPTLYRALAPRLGLLPSDMLIPIASFYDDVFAVGSWVPKMGDHPSRGYSYSPLYVLNPAHNAVTKIVPTLQRIEQLIGVPANEVVGSVDLGRTEEVIQMIEEWHQSASA